MQYGGQYDRMQIVLVDNSSNLFIYLFNMHGVRKRCHFVFTHNFANCWPTVKILTPVYF